MDVLIVESEAGLAELWRCHLCRQGAAVTVALSEQAAVRILQERAIDVIVLDLVLEGGSAFAVADFASYRQPSARVVFVTNTSFFSDGSIFQHIPNACAFLPSGMPPEDLAAVVDHYGEAGAVGGVAAAPKAG
ncbi:response regulator [Psychromarinibacter sp. C21-152]|uniref:Response regulator n=1 Tax=Psychromarinibacter sediminicola TaxID=3033385 RepID=A0AAE3T9T3_9RHOB|nr:response regulator [Psychromarinibacter sediminicola]MDF0600865.1 response regulator [Psychromarinibacter sediminicola]